MTVGTEKPQLQKRTWRNILPGLATLTSDGLKNFRYDLVAAVTLAAYLLPSNIADASLAHLEPQHGLYACLFAGLVFWIFCSGRHTAITVTSAISLLIGSAIADVAQSAGKTPEEQIAHYAPMAAAAALMVAGLSFTAWALRAGSLVSFISETVMLGFKAGVALHLTSTQLPKFFGFSGAHGGDFWDRMLYFFKHLGETNWLALAIGGGALTIIVAGKYLLKNKPVALFVMIAGIILTSYFHLGDKGVKTLGKLPSEIPLPTWPMVTAHEARELFPLAMACFLLSAVETVAIGRMFALKHGYRIDSNQDFLALAAANAAAGLGHAYPVAGGMSQSLVNESAGAKSAFSGFLASCIVIVVAIFFSKYLQDLPQPVLAAIVLAAVTGLVKVSALKRLWKFNRGEFMVSMAALAGVLCFGLLQGVLIGAVLSVMLLLRRASRPHTTELGLVPNSTYFADLKRHKENERVPNVFVFRAGGALLYFNAEFIRDRFVELLNAREDKVQLAVFFMGTSPNVDLAGAEMLEELHASLKARGILFKLAETRGDVRDALRKAGYENHGGAVEANQTVLEIIEQNNKASAHGI